MTAFIELYNVFSRFRKPSEALWETICSKIKAFSFEKREVWIDIGDTPKRIAFIKSGAAVAYEIYPPNERKLVRIWNEGELIINAENALAGKKSNSQIVFLTDTVVYTISYIDLMKLKYNSEEMHGYVDYFIAEEIQKLINHIKWLKDKSAIERIHEFQHQFPLVNYLLTDEQKASYLGMSRRWYNLNK